MNLNTISEQQLEDIMQNEINEADQKRLVIGGSDGPYHKGDPNGGHAGANVPTNAPAPSSLAEMNRIHILATMDWSGGNKALAARQLGITIKTLYTRLHEYGYVKIRTVERRTNGQQI